MKDKRPDLYSELPDERLRLVAENLPELLFGVSWNLADPPDEFYDGCALLITDLNSKVLTIGKWTGNSWLSQEFEDDGTFGWSGPVKGVVAWAKM